MARNEMTRCLIGMYFREICGMGFLAERSE